jgi:hypothetical protein
MKVYLVSYANGRFIPDQALLTASALRFGVTDVRPWSQQMLHRTAFYSENKAILDLERGAGYWLWKPFIISETLKEMEEGDCLIYSDSGIQVVADLTPLFRIALERDLVFFLGTGQCRQWTKRDCFYFLNADEPRREGSRDGEHSPILEAGRYGVGAAYAGASGASPV